MGKGGRNIEKSRKLSKIGVLVTVIAAKNEKVQFSDIKIISIVSAFNGGKLGFAAFGILKHFKVHPLSRTKWVLNSI